MRSRRTTATFITWDGPDQNYLESLFLPIFGRVREEGFDFSVIQFAWGESLRRESTARAAERLGIGYEAHKVLRRPLRPATLATVLIGAARVAAHARAHGTDVLIPRSIIPAAMALLARQYLTDVRIVYDSDGIVADERVEFDGWNGDGVTYRVFRGVEARICRIADSVMTRSAKGARVLKRRVDGEVSDRDVYVVPNGKEPDRFSPGTATERRRVRRDLDVGDTAPMVLYAGSLGDRYLPEHIFRFYVELRRRRPDSHLVVLTGHQELARQVADHVGVDAASLTIQRVEPRQVPRYLAAADLGISFRMDTFSQQCVSPIKIAEYLLCGLPVIATRGVGDVDRQLTKAEGIILPDVSIGALSEAADEFLRRILPHRPCFRHQCRQTGLRHFSIENTARGYRDAIEQAREDSAFSLAATSHQVGRSSQRVIDPSKHRRSPTDATISRYIFETLRL